MIDTVSLRKKIIELALQGLLIPVNEKDDNADELLESILEKRKEYVKTGIIKKWKVLSEIKEEELLFPIPDGWAVKKLGEISLPMSDGIHYAPPYLEDGYPCFSAKDIYNNEIHLDKCTYISADEYIGMKEKINVNEGCILITKSGSIGRSTIVKEYFEFGLVESIGVINPIIVNSEYIKMVLDYGFVYSNRFVEKYTRGVGLKHLTLTLLENIPIPLPNLKIQGEIVETINKVFRILDIIDDLQTSYSSDVGILKNKLIDVAIRGRLTEQLLEDGTAEELYKTIQEKKTELIKAGKIKKENAMPEIANEEIPFEIPGNWKWVRVLEILDVRDGTHDSPQYYENGIPMITSKNLSSGQLDFANVKYVSEEDAKKINERSAVDDGDILFAMIGTIGNPVLVKKEKEFVVKNVALFKKYENTNISMKYIYWYLTREQNEFKKIVSGGLQPFISLKQFRTHIMPLPPYEEQKRIANCLEKLLKDL